MTKREMENRLHMYRDLERLGFTAAERDALRRISMTLHRWSEAECNGEIERYDNTDPKYPGKPVRVWTDDEGTRHFSSPIHDREAGALRRLSAIMAPRKRRLIAYHQGDPRGAALYIVERKRINSRDVRSCYSSAGVAVY